MSHTPGPWEHFTAEFVEEGRSGWAVSVPHELDELTGEALSHRLIAEVAMADDDVTTEANARLIAAAPDLLAALEAFVSINESAGIIDPRVDAEEIEDAKHALYKARGER